MKSNYFLTHIFLLLCLSLFSLNVYANDFPVVFGEVQHAEFTASEFEIEQKASAIVLCDFGQCAVTENGQSVIVTKHIRIKILKSTGYDWADVEIPIYESMKLKEIQACTYNLIKGEIQKTELSKKMILHEDYLDGIEILKFAFPNIKRGSIIEYQYSFELFRISGLWSWTFPKSIPVKHSEFWVQYPFEFKYKVNKTAENLFYHNELMSNEWYFNKFGPSVFHRFIAVFQSPYETEPYVNSKYNFMAGVEFHLDNIDLPGVSSSHFIYSFNKISKDLTESFYFGKKLGSKKFIRDAVAEVVSSSDSQLEKIEKIRDHLTKRLRWNGENRMTTKKSLAKTYREGEGSSADINLLLIQFLQDAGVDAFPLVLSTRSRGTIDRNFAKSDRLNYVLAYVETKYGHLLLDATDRFLPYNMLPRKCLNGEGWLILDVKGEWISLGEDEKNSISTQIKLSIDENEKLNGYYKRKFKGYDAARLRERIYLDGEEKLEQSYKDFFGNWDIHDFQIQNPDNLNEEIIVEFAFETADDIINANNYKYINPFLKNEGISNPFSAKERYSDINFACLQEQQYFIELEIPEDYSIYDIPESMVKILPDKGGQLLFNVTSINNKITILHKLRITNVNIPVDQYLGLKKLYQYSADKQAQMIILEKTN